MEHAARIEIGMPIEDQLHIDRGAPHDPPHGELRVSPAALYLWTSYPR